MNSEFQPDFFSDGMSIFLGYIARQFKKDSNYQPHPIIRAFECAYQGIEKCEIGQTTMGVSQNNIEDSIYEPYFVILQKLANGVEVKEITNAKAGKKLPFDVMIVIFRLQIHLDRIPGNTVTPHQMVDILNAVIPNNNFYALGDRWTEARDLFQQHLKEGKVYLPPEFKRNGMIEELLSIKYSTPWEQYSNLLRAFIGPFIREKLDSSFKVIITSPTGSNIEKVKVCDIATEFMIGQASQFAELLDPKK